MGGLFFAGGALTPNDEFYVRRMADGEALRTITESKKYFHIIAPRQMGKTSLLKRLAADLIKDGWRCSYVDLSSLAKDLEDSTWYYKLGRLLYRRLTPGSPPDLRSQTDLREYLLDSVLVQGGQPLNVALLFDEIGAMFDHPLSDTFFMTLRALYNERDDYEGVLMVGMVGTVDTDQLVKDEKISPFNISEVISLEDFTSEETYELTGRLALLNLPLDASVHDCIYNWTSGHPYLSQRLCHTLEGWVRRGQITSIGPQEVDRAVEETLLNQVDHDSNVKHIRNSLVGMSEAAAGIWQRIVSGDPPRLVELGVSELYLAGVVRQDGSGRAVIRNRVYHEAAQGVVQVSSKQPLAHPTMSPDVSVKLLTRAIPTAYCQQLDEQTFPLVVATLDNSGPGSVNSSLRVSTVIEDYSDSAVTTPDIAQGERISVSLLPVLKPEAVATLNEIRRATLRVTIWQESPTHCLLYDQTWHVHLLARDTALLGIENSDGTLVDLTRYLASWVTPHPLEIEQLLRKAAAYHPGKNFAGYQGASTPSEMAVIVRAQVRAIFDALKNDANLIYINSPLSLGEDTGRITQRVRLPIKCLQSGGSANCIDGTVLFASLLELASITPLIVIVPEHAFLGWKVSEDSDVYEFLETTMIGTADFDSAQKAAQDSYREALLNDYFSRDLFAPDGFARLIDVSTARAEGIYPLE